METNLILYESSSKAEASVLLEDFNNNDVEAATQNIADFVETGPKDDDIIILVISSKDVDDKDSKEEHTIRDLIIKRYGESLSSVFEYHNKVYAYDSWSDHFYKVTNLDEDDIKHLKIGNAIEYSDYVLEFKQNDNTSPIQYPEEEKEGLTENERKFIEMTTKAKFSKATEKFFGNNFNML